MPKFNVSVMRTAFQHQTFEIEADTEEEAERKAMDVAPNHSFPNASEADYEVTGAVLQTEIKPG